MSDDCRRDSGEGFCGGFFFFSSSFDDGDEESVEVPSRQASVSGVSPPSSSPPPQPREELGEDRARAGLARDKVDHSARLLVPVGPRGVGVAREDRARRLERADGAHAAPLLRLRVAAVLDLEAGERHRPLRGEPHLHRGRGLPRVGPHHGLVLREKKTTFFFFRFWIIFCFPFGVSFFPLLLSFSPSLYSDTKKHQNSTRNGAWLGSMLFSAINSQSTGGLWKPQSPPAPKTTAFPPPPLFSSAAAALAAGLRSSTSGSGTLEALSNPPSRSSWAHTKRRFCATRQGNDRSLARGEARTVASALASLACGQRVQRPRSPPNSHPWYRHDRTPPSSLPSDIAARRCGHSSTAARQAGGAPSLLSLSLPSNHTTRLFPSSVTLFGFDGSSVERTEPTGYQLAAQSKDSEGGGDDEEEEAAASSAAEEAAREMERGRWAARES